MYVLLNVQVCDRCAAQINHIDRQNELQQTIIIIITTKCHVAKFVVYDRFYNYLSARRHRPPQPTNKRKFDGLHQGTQILLNLGRVSTQRSRAPVYSSYRHIEIGRENGIKVKLSTHD